MSVFPPRLDSETPNSRRNLEMRCKFRGDSKRSSLTVSVPRRDPFPVNTAVTIANGVRFAVTAIGCRKCGLCLVCSRVSKRQTSASRLQGASSLEVFVLVNATYPAALKPFPGVRFQSVDPR